VSKKRIIFRYLRNPTRKAKRRTFGPLIASEWVRPSEIVHPFNLQRLQILALGFEVLDRGAHFRKPLPLRAYGLVIVTLALAVAELKFASPL
jgi:hypothetical protein